MQVKILEEKILEGREVFLKDEVRSVPDDMAKRWIAAGWAKDVTGEIPTGERKNKGEDLEINPLKLVTSNKAV